MAAITLALAAVALIVWRTALDSPRGELEPTDDPPAAAHGDGRKTETARRLPSPEPNRSSAEPAGPLAPKPEPEDAIRIDVVDEATGDPAPGATVLFLDWEEHQGEEDIDEQALLGGPFEPFERLGRRYRSDETGAVLIPRPRVGAVIAGKLGDLRGMLAVAADTRSGTVLELARNRRLLVRVVDPSGEPVAGVDVAWRTRNEFDSGLVLRTASTDDRGIATFDFLDLYISSGDERRHSVALPVVSEKPVEAVVDPLDVPADPVELVLPSCGRVVVKVVDAAGRPFAEPAVVSLEMSAPERTGDRVPWRRPVTVVEGGVATFPLVATGRSLRVHVNPSDRGGVRPVQRALAGPRRRGEEVTTIVVLDELKPVIAGRAVDGRGQALAGVSLEYLLRQIHEGGGGGRGSVAKTDADGMFRIALEHGEPDEGCTRRLEIDLERDEGPPLEGAADLTRAFAPGETDIGDVVLAPKPLLVSGVVRDGQGRLVAGAKIEVEMVFSPFPDVQYWAMASDLWSRPSDRHGRFAVHGGCDGDAIRVCPQKEGYVAAPVELKPGTSGAELTLKRGSSLVVRALLPDGLPPSDVFVGLRPADGDRNRDRGKRALGNDASLTLTGIAAGEHDLTVTFEGHGSPLARRRIRVRGGSNELPAIDLRGVVQVVRLSVVDSRGAPVPRCRVGISSASTGESLGSVSWAPDRPRLVAAAGPWTLRLSAGGFRTRTVENVLADTEVVLRDGIAVNLVLAKRPELPGPEFVIEVALTPHPGTWPAYTGSTAFDDDGEARLTLPAPGEYHAGFVLYRVRGGSRHGRRVATDPVPVVEVDDTEGEQRITITFAPTDLDAAIAGLTR